MYTGFDSSYELIQISSAILTTPDDNSLNNLDALRGVFGTRPRPGTLTNFLSAAFTFNAEALFRELYSGVKKNLAVTVGLHIEDTIKKHPAVLTAGCLAF